MSINMNEMLGSLNLAHESLARLSKNHKLSDLKKDKRKATEAFEDFMESLNHESRITSEMHLSDLLIYIAALAKWQNEKG